MPRSTNRLPEMKRAILAALAQAQAVRITCERPRKLARELRKQMRMCEIKIEDERSEKLFNGRRRSIGVLVVSWAKT